MTSAPPGWYPDASQPGNERWWDGGQWSHVTRPAAGGQQAPTQPETQIQTQPEQSGSAPDGDPYAPPREQDPQGQTQQYGQQPDGSQQYGQQPYGQPDAGQQYGQQ